MPRLSKTDRRRNARSTRPVWIDIAGDPYLAENWSLGGILVRDRLFHYPVGDRVLARLSLDPISGSPFAYVHVRVVRCDGQGTALAFCDLPVQLFDLLSEAMFRRPPMAHVTRPAPAKRI